MAMAVLDKLHANDAVNWRNGDTESQLIDIGVHICFQKNHDLFICHNQHLNATLWVSRAQGDAVQCTLFFTGY